MVGYETWCLFESSLGTLATYSLNQQLVAGINVVLPMKSRSILVFFCACTLTPRPIAISKGAYTLVWQNFVQMSEFQGTNMFFLLCLLMAVGALSFHWIPLPRYGSDIPERGASTSLSFQEHNCSWLIAIYESCSNRNHRIVPYSVPEQCNERWK